MMMDSSPSNRAAHRETGRSHPISFMKPDVMSSQSRTPKPNSARSVAPAIERNISAMVAARQDVERSRGIGARMANAITGFAGSLAFLALHVIWFGGWILWNVSLSNAKAFDPFPFGMLTTIVSLEAIFLSAFVLMSQKRDARIADQRADLDVQINLLAEHEITRLLRLADAIASRLGVDTTEITDLQDLKQDVQPDAVLQKLATAEGDSPD